MTELLKALGKDEVLKHVRFRDLKVSGTKAALIEACEGQHAGVRV